jgi:hypothetical protein
VARVELSRTAADDLARMILTHSLSADTGARVAASLHPLERFPSMGAELGRRWTGFRFVLGPWRWMILLYVFLENEDRVVVLTVQYGRASRAATSERR